MEKMTAFLYAARGFVAAVEVPPFETGYPPALVWGNRFFLRMAGADHGEYAETFCYTATVEVIDRNAEPRRPGLEPSIDA